VDPLKIRPGQKINLPAPAQATETTTLNNNNGAAAASGTSGATTQVYTVKSGDTLTRIAERHGTTVRQIRQANNLATSRINLGQKLKIPAKNSAATPTNANGATDPAPQAF
jgi:LysM repeat protein